MPAAHPDLEKEIKEDDVHNEFFSHFWPELWGHFLRVCLFNDKLWLDPSVVHKCWPSFYKKAINTSQRHDQPYVYEILG